MALYKATRNGQFLGRMWGKAFSHMLLETEDKSSKHYIDLKGKEVPLNRFELVGSSGEPVRKVELDKEQDEKSELWLRLEDLSESELDSEYLQVLRKAPHVNAGKKTKIQKIVNALEGK